jgi:hypothetical protein
MGKKAYGVSAGAAEIHFTVRSDSNMQMKRLSKKNSKKLNNMEQFNLK